MKRRAESFFIADPISFIAREGTTFYCKSALLYCESPGIAILHGQRKMIFENRAPPPWVLTSGFHCGKLRRGTSYPKAGAFRSLIRNVPKMKALVTNRSLMRIRFVPVSGGERKNIDYSTFYVAGKRFSWAGQNEIPAKFSLPRQSWPP